MASKKIIHAALGGPPGSNIAFFFRGDQYVAYDWVKDRVTMGLKSISDDWALPGGWLPGAFGPRFAAALSGHEVGQAAYTNKHYFFHQHEYSRHDWTSGKPRPSDSIADSAAWRWPDIFADGIDTCVNGKYSRKGKSYFLKGDKYARYDWAQDRLDYVKTIDQMAPGTFPAGFTSDFDALVNGEGAYADYVYFFRDDQYIRMDWDNGGTTPHVDGPPRSIKAWPGLAEMLLACEAKAKAFEWVWTALPQLQAYVAAVRSGISPAGAGPTLAALQTHFRLTDVTDLTALDPILANLDKIEKYLHRTPDVVKFSTLAQCQADGMIQFQKDTSGNFLLDHNGAKIPQTDSEGNVIPAGAAYTSFDTQTSITPLFSTKGEACRAAQMIHEAGHFVDSNNNTPNDIPEWYVTQPVATALNLTFQPNTTSISTRYDQMTQALAQHNPSSYSAFCQQLRYNRDTRYGELVQDPIPGFY